jgi:hypothetical protein
LKALLLSAKQLQCLDLQGSTVILHTDGHTAEQLRSGRYVSPAAAASQHKQQQGQHGPAGSSRRDLAGVPVAGQSFPAAAAAGGGCSGDLAVGGAGSSGSSGGSRGAGDLQELLMSECQLALEGFPWHQAAPAADTLRPLQPSELLYDLVLCMPQQLQHLRALSWDRADAGLAYQVLSEAVPRARSCLTYLSFSGCNLPDDPSRCWQGLAAATRLRVLDLNHTGFSRHGYASLCGTNPTVSLLAAVAGMRLQQLKLAGWRFFFASFKPLAGLADCLGCLDLSRARDVTDSTLWSLTHLTSRWQGTHWSVAVSKGMLWLVAAHSEAQSNMGQREACRMHGCWRMLVFALTCVPCCAQCVVNHLLPMLQV